MSVSANSPVSEDGETSRRDFMKKTLGLTLSPSILGNSTSNPPDRKSTDDNQENEELTDPDFRGFLISSRNRNTQTGEGYEQFVGKDRLFIQPLGDDYNYEEGDYIEIPLDAIDVDEVFQSLYDERSNFNNDEKEAQEYIAELLKLEYAEPDKLVNELYTRAEHVLETYESSKTNEEPEIDSKTENYSQSIEEWHRGW